MVVKKKNNNGFHGYRVPVIPRGPRSVRRRDLLKRTIEDSQICAFELLATVAGKLLLESEGSASSNATEGKDPSTLQNGGVKPEQLEEVEAKALGSECLDQESCVESVSVAGRHVESILRAFPPVGCDPVLESTSVISSSNFSGKVGHDLKLEIPEDQASLEKSFFKLEGGSSDCGQSCDGHVDSGIARQLEDEGDRNYNVHLTTANTSNPKDEIETCVNIHPWINSDSRVQLTSFRDSVPNASFPRRRNTVKVVTRDDDEKFVRSNLPNSKIRAFKPHRIGHRRIRKLLTSRYWKVAPKLKDCEYSNTNGHIRCVSRNRKILHTCERIQREGPFKKRRILDSSSALAYDGEGSSESISNSPEKVMKGEKSGSAVNKASLASAASHPSAHSKESHVKFSIKSFKVPDLYIEVSETSTVGSLKRKVMEAVTAILQGGLHIGVLLQGKEVKDDNRTLLQTGICHNDYLDTLGFTLEPSSATASPPMSPKDPPVLLPCETQQDLTRLTVSPILDMELANASCDPPPVANVLKHVESNHELALSPTHEVTYGTTPDSRALVSIPPISAEALDAIPLNQKSRRSELAQRRIRRPFSVSEVEALVEAVEKLGTGRWRDVKLRAFEDADHRTYVDLKDKWKTLVHTASIAPQQRRGQPVPQDLLDRVLCAHSYWSQHQSKLHGKNHTEPLKISDTPTGQV